MTGIPHDLDLGVLLAERDFVRRLARSLVTGADRADDVAQQAWLATLRRPPRSIAASRSFLARVTRNVASNLARGERRRQHREREAAAARAGEVEPSVDDALQRETVRQEVVAELRALPEPYRSTVVLRFFEDLQPHAIARRTGVPAGTVRTRLKRGLDMLRERLDRNHGGDRRAWCTPLLPLVRQGAEPATLTTAAGAAGAWSMKKTWLLLATLMALVGTFAWFGRPGDIGAGQRPIAAEPLAAAAAAEDDVRAAAAAPAERVAVAAPAVPAAAVPPRDAATYGGYRGRLLMPDGGTPAPGRRVLVAGIDPSHLFDASAAAGGGLDLVRSEAVSAADGTFLVERVEPRALLVLRAGIDAGEGLCMPITTSAAAGEVVDLGDLVLDALATVTGRVEDVDGEPVAGADVWAADLPALVRLAVSIDRFDPDHGGMLLLPEADAGEQPADFAARLRRFFAEDLFMRADLEPDAGHRVHVVDTPRWLREFWAALPLARARSGSDGAFTLRGLAQGSNMLVVRADGHGPGGRPSIVVGGGEERDIGTVTLAEGEVCTVRVVDGDGAPVAGAAVRAASLPIAGFVGIAFCEAEVHTGSDGRVELHGIPAGRMLVAARRPAQGEAWAVVGPLPGGADSEICLPARHRLRIVATGPGGSRPEIDVTCQPGPGIGEVARLGILAPPRKLAATAGEDGAWMVDGLAPGTHVLTIGARGCAPVRRLVRVPDTGELRLEFAAPAAPLTVRVSDDAGRPLAGVLVRVRPAAPDFGRRVLPTYFGLPSWDVLPDVAGWTDGAGQVRLDRLAPGATTIWATHPAHGPAQADVDLPADPVHLRLPAPATLHGRLTVAGQPADARAWRLVAIPASSGEAPDPYALATPAADGSYRLSGLRPGAHALTVLPALERRLSVGALVELLRERVFSFGFFGERSEDVVLAAGESRRFDLDVHAEHQPPAPKLALTGTVTVDNAPAAGLRLQLDVSGFGGIDTGLLTLAVSDAAGRLAATLDEGVHGLALIDPDSGWRLWQGSVTCQPNGDNHVAIAIDTASIRGFVVAPPSRDLRGAKVWGRSERGQQVSTTVSVDGSFALLRLPAGRWHLSVASESVGSDDEVEVAAAAGAELAAVELRAAARFVVEAEIGVVGLTEAALISLTRDDGRWVMVQRLGDDGMVRWTGLPAGTYRIAYRSSWQADEVECGSVELAGDLRHRLVVTPDAVTVRR